MTFQFDTSGFVQMRFDDASRVFWSDLSPFEQGHVEAMFAGITHATLNGPSDMLPGYRCDTYRGVAFSDVAPETLERIRKDCERYAASIGWRLDDLGAGAGRIFCKHCQEGARVPAFVPQTPFLDSNGKVRFR